MKSREVKIIDLNDFYVISIGVKIDHNIVSAIKTAFRDFESQTDLKYVSSSSMLNESDEILFTDIFAKHLQRIVGSRNNKVSTVS